jgi:hypothetical protein
LDGLLQGILDPINLASPIELIALGAKSPEEMMALLYLFSMVKAEEIFGKEKRREKGFSPLLKRGKNVHH